MYVPLSSDGVVLQGAQSIWAFLEHIDRVMHHEDEDVGGSSCDHWSPWSTHHVGIHHPIFGQPVATADHAFSISSSSSSSSSSYLPVTSTNTETLSVPSQLQSSAPAPTPTPVDNRTMTMTSTAFSLDGPTGTNDQRVDNSNRNKFLHLSSPILLSVDILY